MKKITYNDASRAMYDMIIGPKAYVWNFISWL